jgi:CMP/dCMP kinase
VRGIYYINFLEFFKKSSRLKKLVIAIDGPAASGKSTTARLVAERLGYRHVDTGGMYRAMTLKILRAGIDPADTIAVDALARATGIRVETAGGTTAILLDGEDVSDAIRTPEVTRAVSQVSAVRSVRELMVREQRRLAAGGGVVLEGRDIGSVVLPEADVKIFLVAEPSERARRRRKELLAQGIDIALDELESEIRERDRKDSSREISPLRKADGAVEVDTSKLTVDEQVGRILGAVEQFFLKSS